MSANPFLCCGFCGTSLSGGTDTFGTIGENLCVSCYFLFKPRDLDEENAQFREAFSQPRDGRFVTLPNEADFSCPSCKEVPLAVEITEWESETGIPTEGGTLLCCNVCGHDFADYLDPVELFEIGQKAERWARKNARMQV